MGRYHSLAKVAKPYELKDGDVVVAYPGRELVIADHLDSSTSIVKGRKAKLLTKIEEPKVVVVEPPPVVAKTVSPVAEAAHEASKVVEEKLSPTDEEKPVEEEDVSTGTQDGSEEGGSHRGGNKRGKWPNRSR